MSEISYTGSRGPARVTGERTGANLADLLERILDKGIVIVGDIRVNLLDIELLTIKLRLLVASVDRAKEMGIDWWEHDPSLSSRARAETASAEHDQLERDRLAQENRMLRERLAALEAAVSPDRQVEAHHDAEHDSQRDAEPRSRAAGKPAARHDTDATDDGEEEGR